MQTQKEIAPSTARMRAPRMRAEHLAAAAVVLVGVALRAYQANYNFDGDEVFSVRLAAHSLGQEIPLVLADVHPPLYYVLLHFWMSMFGSSEVAVRSASLLFSAAFLVLSYVLLRRLCRPWPAAGALLLLAISPFFVYYGQQARPYALIAALAALNLICYLRLLENPGKPARLFYWCGTCALLLYAQYLALLVVALEAVVALLASSTARLRILGAGLVAMLVFAPWPLAAMDRAVLAGSDPLVMLSWIGAPTPRDLLWFYVSVFGDLGQSLHVKWLALLLIICAVPFAARVCSRRHLSVEEAFILLLALGVPVCVYLLSLLGPRPVFAARQLIVSALGVMMLIALFLRASPPLLAVPLLSLLALWMAVALPRAFPENAKPPWRRIAQSLDANYESAPVYTEDIWIAEPLGYYRAGADRVLLRDGRRLLSGSADVLAMCRVPFCQDFESGALHARSSLLASWSWGLRLYALNAAGSNGPVQ